MCLSEIPPLLPVQTPIQNQLRFLEQMLADGAIAGICRSPEDALRLIGVDQHDNR